MDKCSNSHHYYVNYNDIENNYHLLLWRGNMHFQLNKLSLSVRTVFISLMGLSATNIYADEYVTQLETITIKAGQDQAYKIKESATALKMGLSLKETPQAVSIVTDQQMQDQNLDKLGDVLNQVVGISSTQFASNGADDTFNTYYARGFSIDNYQVDGINTTSKAIGNTTSLNTAIYENVTVLKGANGLLSGAGNPSATINLVRKKPTQEFQSSINVEAGSWDKYRTEIDISGALNDKGTVRGRSVVAVEDYESYQERANGREALIYGVVEVDIAENTTVNVGIDAYQKDNNALTSHGLNILNHDLTQKTPFGPKDNLASNWSYDDASRINLFTGIEHRFENGWDAGLNLGYSKVDSDILYGMAGRQSINLDKDTMQFRADRNTYTPEQWNLDAHAKGPFKLFSREHQAVIGLTAFDMSQEDTDWKVSNVPGTVSVSDWNGEVAHPTIEANGIQKEDQKQMTAYGALRLNLLDPLHVILGGSVHNWEKTTENASNTERLTETGEVVPYAGIVYNLNKDWAVYSSYTNIFKPQSSKDYSGSTLAPISGDTFEIGVKGDLFNERLNLSLSVFKTKQDNVAVEAGEYTQEDLDAGLIPVGKDVDDTYYRAGQGVKSEGFEVEVGGEILPNWRVAGGYSYVKTEDQGTRINTNLPQDQLKLFTSYTFSGALEKLTVGAGVKWQSDIYANESQKNLYKQDSYTLVDLMARYKANEQMSFGLNVSNLTNEEYLVGTMARSNVWGAPRSVTGSVHFKF